jgi:hypothetical protein
MGSAETALKVRWISERWRLLTAGSEPSIITFANLLIEELANGVTATNLDGKIKGVVHKRKKGAVGRRIREN